MPVIIRKKRSDEETMISGAMDAVVVRFVFDIAPVFPKIIGRNGR